MNKIEKEILSKPFNKEDIKNLLINNFFPENFEINEEKLSIADIGKFEKIQEVFYIGKSSEPEINLLFIKHNGINDPRITITKETFKIVKAFGYKRSIIVYYSDSENYRISLITLDIQKKGESQIEEVLSNPKRYSYFLGPDSKTKTPYINLISKGRVKNDEDLKGRFSVKVVTDEFYEAYRYALKEIIIKSLKKYDVSYEIKHSFSQQLLSRIVFIYFLQQKGWFKWNNYQQDKNYIKNLWTKYKVKYKKDNFYSVWLKTLFFGAFNNNKSLIYNNKNLPEEIQFSFLQMPYLNGGLFLENELDKNGFDIPDTVFEWLFEPNNENKNKGFLEIFNFTINESSPIDIDVAVDPEMLGKVYESLINNEERGVSGTFYTHRTEIDFMCRLSIVNYLYSKTDINKEELINIIFNPESINTYEKIESLRIIKTHLDKVKIVDPAVGSASFLVGMMNILVEIQYILTKKIENRNENLFALKEKIICENLYGVDVKDWAVMVGELRLWLSLIIETDEKYMDIYTKPLLPNLSFKIRQGDSLVEEIGGFLINLRGGELKSIPRSIHKIIFKLIDKKSKFFSGQRSSNLKEKEEIENLENEIFKEILNNNLKEKEEILTQKNKDLKVLRKGELPSDYLMQQDFFKSNIEIEKKEIKKLCKKSEEEAIKLQQETNQIKNIFKSIKSKSKKSYFLWEIDFAEVFTLNYGFDIVIGNPPYVRQELIAPPLENEKNYTPDYWRELKTEYKDKLIKSVQTVWGNVIKIDKKSDLYVFFYYQGLSLLNDGGIFCFINSNSWLDVGYGAGLQEFLLKNMKPLYIIDNIAKRSFKADINTVIVVIQKSKTKLDDFTLKFIAFKKPFEESITPNILKEIEKTNKPVFNNPVYRVYPKTKKELLQEGVEYPEESKLALEYSVKSLPYIGNKWGGKYLRAPEIYFKILEKGKDKLVRLEDIAKVRRGLVTGLDSYLFLNEQEIEKYKIEKIFLKKVLITPRQVNKHIVKKNSIDTYAIYTDYSKNKLKSTYLLKYINDCEIKGALKKAAARDKKLWYSIRKQEINYPCIAIPRAPYNRYPVLLVYDNLLVNDVVIINPYNKKDLEFIFLLIVNTFGIFLLEVNSRHNLGLGTLKFEKLDAVRYSLINITFFENDYKVKLLRCFDSFKYREIHDIFTELGFDNNSPIREQDPNPLPDRKELDNIVFDVLGLTAEERKEVYWAVAELVKARLDKAKSV